VAAALPLPVAALHKYGRINVAQTLLSVLVRLGTIEKTSATILSLDDGMREIAYEETEHYRVTRDFFNHRKKMLDELLS
jgi:hypothetical protein